MASVLGFLVVAAIVIVLAVIAVKILIALLLVLLVVGGICLVVFIVSGASDDANGVKKEIAYTQNTVRLHVVQFRDDVQRDYHEQMLSMTRHKSGVSFNMLRPEMDSVISVVASVYHTAMNDDEFMPLITSANDYEAMLKGPLIMWGRLSIFASRIWAIGWTAKGLCRQFARNSVVVLSCCTKISGRRTNTCMSNCVTAPTTGMSCGNKIYRVIEKCV
ncbi:hypothetical protein [Fibrobacter sp.]|uniref:hypothetical protein n=1 Tax=Fibrobacter sp. TaxID=35828 RepID=UPI00260FAD26|nr:hypothetical protein [Fibrobacter sp.]MDD5941368.1 hypothetical protein [Fibrobacter sp.]